MALSDKVTECKTLIDEVASLQASADAAIKTLTSKYNKDLAALTANIAAKKEILDEKIRLYFGDDADVRFVKTLSPVIDK